MSTRTSAAPCKCVPSSVLILVTLILTRMRQTGLNAGSMGLVSDYWRRVWLEVVRTLCRRSRFRSMRYLLGFIASIIENEDIYYDRV